MPKNRSQRGRARGRYSGNGPGILFPKSSSTSPSQKKKKSKESFENSIDLDSLEAAARKGIRRLDKKKIKIQPQGKKKYGGMGLARSSQFIDLCEPDLMERWQIIWSEHIEGFGMGLAFKKSLKKHRESNMLWRVR